MSRPSVSEDSSSDQDRGYRDLLQSTAVISGPTLVSRILGYIRDMLQAFFLGTGIGADAFTVAFVIPNLLRALTAEGALTAAFIPTFTRVKKSGSPPRTQEFTNNVFSSLALVVLGITLLGILFAPFLVKTIAYGYSLVPGKLGLTVSLLRIMFPFIFFISLAALCSAVLNAHFRFGLAASSSIFFNLAMITVVFWLARRTPDPAYAFALGVLVGGLFQLLIQIPAVRGLGYSLKPHIDLRDRSLRKVGRLMLPGIVGLGIFQINLALSRLLASLLPEGSVAALYYATRMVEFTLGLFSLAVAKALLPTLSQHAADGDLESLKRTLLFSLKFLSFVTIPASAGLFLLAKPIIRVLFERGAFQAASTELTAGALLFLALGLPFSSGNRVLKKAFFSLEDTQTPVKVAGVSVLFYLGLSFLFMQFLGIGGLALGLAVTEFLYFGVIWFLLRKKIGRIPTRSLGVFGTMVLICAALMGAALVLLNQALNPPLEFWPRLFDLLIRIGAGMGVYGLSALLLMRRELQALRALFSRTGSEIRTQS